MKKAYSKPEILFEDFSLCTHIATDCNIFPGDGRLEFPYMGDTFVTLFFANSCEFDIEYAGGDGGYNGLCYHNPTDATMVFNS